MKISTQGDAGDCLYLLNLIRQIPDGPHTLCLRPGGGTKYRTPADMEKLHAFLAPLAESLPYVKEVVIIGAADPVDWASEGFRRKFYTPGETLMQAHLNHLTLTRGIGRDFDSHKPWLLNIEPAKRSKGAVVINHTARYRNPFFGWAQVVEHYRHRLLFIGLEHEWREFIGHFGYVEFQPTNNLLEVAQLIAGSELFIGNQSCAYACAEGLKHRSIQETSLEIPDCVYGRPNATYCAKGECLLPDIAGSGEHQMKFRVLPSAINPGNVPPGGWKYPGVCSQIHLRAQIAAVHRENPGMTMEETQAAILQYNADLNPEFFAETSLDTAGSRYRLAMQSAGL